MSVTAKCVLFLLLGLTVGAGITAAVFGFVVIPKFNSALDDDQKVIDGQKQAAASWQQAADIGNSTLRQCSDALKEVAQRTTVPTPGISTIYDATAGTVIFEPSTRQVDVHLSVGMLHGLNLANLPTFKVGPTGQMAPHWIIPTKVVPVFVGDSHGAVYYFLENNQLTGPIAPQPLPQQ